jgi:biopolymer transport protein ExbD
MRRKTPPDRPEMPIAPMIDCVFLMLVYFMTTSSLDKSEAELPFPFTAAAPASTMETAIDEQRIRLTGEAQALWNGAAFRLTGTAASEDLQRLARQLQAFRGATELAGREAAVRLLPEAQCPHQALVRMLDALDKAGIERVKVP